MRKFVVILIIILLYSVACKKEDFLWELPKKPAPTCYFLYSVWTPCLKNIQTRTYTSSPSGCLGTPPADSIQRTCVPCKFVYSAWSSCTNNVQTRTYISSPIGCYDSPPADSIQRSCVPPPCSFLYSIWTPCSFNLEYRSYTSSPSGCSGSPPADSTRRSCVSPPCSFLYSAWNLCSNNVQSRTFISSPSGCSGSPPADSTQRPCVILTEVSIGSQTWALKNLDVSTYRNGDPIPEVQNPTTWASLTTGAWTYYIYTGVNGANYYGKLYNWYAVNDPRGLAPLGFHIPSDAEWTTLTNWLGGENQAGGKMKETGFSHWLSPNTGATNSSGFTGLPGGYRDDLGVFHDIYYYGGWWSSSESSSSTSWSRYLYFGIGNVTRLAYYKQYGFSVRCIKD